MGFITCSEHIVTCIIRLILWLWCCTVTELTSAVCESSELNDVYNTVREWKHTEAPCLLCVSLQVLCHSTTACFTVTRSSICWGIRRAHHTNIRGSAPVTQDGASSQLICWQGPPGAPRRRHIAAGWGHGHGHGHTGDCCWRHTLI